MGDHVCVNGRKIRIRPAETSEVDEKGFFHRQENAFTGHFGNNSHPVEENRYILFWSKGCAWSNRTVIVIELLGLSKAIKTEDVDWTDLPENLGWEFVNSPNHINPETGARFLSELYYNTDENYSGRTTVPALVDYRTKTVVNNDFHTLTTILETEFRTLHRADAPNLYPLHLRADIDRLNGWLFHHVNDAIYRACFARSPEAYYEGYDTFFHSLSVLDRRLSSRRFLFGDHVTDSDIRLFTTLARLDINYSRHIGPCPKLEDYQNLWEYARDLYQIPAFYHNTFFQDFAATQTAEKKGPAFRFNPYYDMVVPRTDYDEIWKSPTTRAQLSKDPSHKFVLSGGNA